MVPPHRNGLTGQTRYRTERIGGMFDKREALVLQVHHEWRDGPCDSNGMPAFLAGQGWRDAKTEDLATIEEIERGAALSLQVRVEQLAADNARLVELLGNAILSCNANDGDSLANVINDAINYLGNRAPVIGEPTAPRKPATAGCSM